MKQLTPTQQQDCINNIKNIEKAIKSLACQIEELNRDKTKQEIKLKTIKIIKEY